MMIRFFHISLFFLITLSGMSQSLQIKIIDGNSGYAIENVHLIYSEGHALTDKRGVARIIVAQPTTISVSHISYRDTIIYIGNISFQEYVLRLSPQINSLKGVEVNTKPHCLFAPEKTHVFDFELRNDTLLILTYTREKMWRRHNRQSEALYLGCSLLVVSPSGNILDSIRLPDLIKSFYTDPLGNIFILAESEIFLTELKKGVLTLSTVAEADFQNLIKPLTGNSQTTYFYNDYEWDYPEFSYYGLNKTSGSIQLVRTVRDDLTMELFRAEYKYLSKPDKLKARRLEYKTGIDKEIFGAYMSGFAHHYYYQKLYAPLFGYGDSLLIFDHHSNQIFLHNGIGTRLDSVDIHYHKNRNLKFKNEIINDAQTRSFYGVFEKSGIKALREIDPFSGESLEIIDLYYAYPEKLKVRNHKIYYIYRKTGGPGTKHLYVEP